MRTSTLLYLVLTIIAFAGDARAEAICGKPASYVAALECALARHPELALSELGVGQAEKLRDFAAQRPNPELASQAIFGGSNSGNYLAAEMNFAHTFELGGKRSSRIQTAEADILAARGQRTATSEEVYLKTALALHRMRQLKDEIGAVEDALQTFARLSKQYRGRPRLNPEQKTALRIFEIAEQEYRTRQVNLDSERELRLREIEIAVGQPLGENSGAIPLRRKQWPAPPELPSDGGARILIADAELERAKAGLDQAKAEAWPDLKAGPTLYQQRQSGQGFSAIGLNFSLPLPIYNRNEARKAVAAIGLDRSERLRALAAREAELERAYLKHRYTTAVGSLASAGNTGDLLEKHHETESLFAQGFLNGTAVIEMHRQISDLIKSRNEQELAAEEALIRLYALAGKLPEVLNQ